MSLPSVDETTTRSPVELELTGAIGHGGSIKSQRLVGRLGGGKLNKAVAGITGEDGCQRLESRWERYHCGRTQNSCRE